MVLFLSACAAYFPNLNPQAITKQQGERLKVKIGDEDFGLFEQVSGLGEYNTSKPTSPGDQLIKVTLGRRFVASSSLFRWAGSLTSQGQRLRDIELVSLNQDNETIAVYTLKHCKPLSWSIANDPEFGGFQEKVELAVQEMQIHR
jgi:hypothetical protein